jgi:hypothetical protein
LGRPKTRGAERRERDKSLDVVTESVICMWLFSFTDDKHLADYATHSMYSFKSRAQQPRSTSRPLMCTSGPLSLDVALSLWNLPVLRTRCYLQLVQLPPTPACNQIRRKHALVRFFKKWNIRLFKHVSHVFHGDSGYRGWITSRTHSKSWRPATAYRINWDISPGLITG